MNLIPYLKLSGKYQLFNRSKNEFVSNEEFDEIILGYDETYTVLKDNKYGILDADGIKIIDCQYEFASGFDKNKLARVKINQKYGCIDETGNIVIPATHEYISNFYQGLAKVKINGRYKFINTLGEIVSHKEYEETSIFLNGKCAVKYNGKWGLINKYEEFVIPPLYDSLSEENTTCRVEIDGRFFLIDFMNQQVSEKYDYIDHLSDETYQVSRQGLWGHIKNNGEVLIPTIYDNSSDFKGDFAGVFSKGNWLFINRSNIVILERNKFNICDVLNSIEDGIVVAQNNSGWGLVDLNTGESCVNFQYDNSWGISEGLCSFEKNGKWGYISASGEVIVDFKYSDPGYFKNGITEVAILGKIFNKDKTTFYIDNKGFEFRDQKFVEP